MTDPAISAPVLDPPVVVPELLDPVEPDAPAALVDPFVLADAPLIAAVEEPVEDATAADPDEVDEPPADDEAPIAPADWHAGKHKHECTYPASHYLSNLEQGSPNT